MPELTGVQPKAPRRNLHQSRGSSAEDAVTRSSRNAAYRNHPQPDEESVSQANPAGQNFEHVASAKSRQRFREHMRFAFERITCTVERRPRQSLRAHINMCVITDHTCTSGFSCVNACSRMSRTLVFQLRRLQDQTQRC